MVKNLLYSIGLILLIASCSVQKFIPEDELLYTGADITIESDTTINEKEELKAELESVIRPEPNTKILGSRFGLYFWYKANREKPGFINKFLNDKFGEEPVYLSDVNENNINDLLINRVENRGFFYSRVNSKINEDPESKTGSANFVVRVPEPYTMATYQMENDTLMVYRHIENNLGNTILEDGMRFDLPRLKQERERIDVDLKKDGYYNFNPGFLIFEADTNQYDNRKFDLFLRLKKDVPERSVIPYQISNVNVYANYNIEKDSVTGNFERIENKNYFQENEFFKPERLEPFILIETGDYYDPETSRITSRRLSSIGSYKFVNIQYKEIDTLAGEDSLGLLEANIYLSPYKKRSLRAELQAVTKSNSFTGPHLAGVFTNRNLFKGGENLHITGDIGYEFQLASGNNSGLSSLQLGLKGDLILPRLMLPINFDKNFFKYEIPKTKITLGGEHLRRSQLFSLSSLIARFGYIWNANRYVYHEFDPISLNYVRLGSKSEEFQAILDDNPFLQSSFDQELIAGLTYAFTYNGMVDVNKTHAFFLNTNLDVAGNTFSLFGQENENGMEEVLGLEYAQYAKLDADFRYHLRLPKEQVIATRLFAGYGMPYGNSDVMPYSKQYFAGGPYSVRAFRIRSLGPGTYTHEEDEDSGFRDQTGNVRLEANIEYRFPIFSYLKGAAFIDAGNVWTTNEQLIEDESGNLVNLTPGGKLESDFLTELGIGGGVGLRIDIQSFVIRFDLAAPFHDPAKPQNERWVWDITKPVFNFGIGYPF